MIRVKIDTKYLKLNSKEQLDKEAQKLLSESAFLAYKEVVAKTPVDTGLAQDSWKITITDGKAELKNEQDYVKYLNAGSSKQAPRLFIEQTLLNYGKPKGPIVTYE